MENNEIAAVRIFFYELIRETFYDEPDSGFINIFNQFVENLKSNADAENENLLFMINSFDTVLNELSVQDIKDEYNTLFVDPFSNSLINKNASYHLENKNFGQTLVEIRDFLLNLNLQRSEEFNEPEDSISFVADVMIYLISSEEKSNNINEQYDFFVRFIDPLFLNISESLKSNENVNFYACIGLLLDFFMDMEKGYLSDAIITT